MRLLILGGTRFLGRRIAEAALRAGDKVTLFHRGRTGPDLFPQAEHRFGDRDGGLDVLGDADWDAVVDTGGYVPRLVEAAARRLAGRVEYDTFIHVGDEANWILDGIRKGKTGVFNVTGPQEPTPLRDLVETSRVASGSQAEFEWVPGRFLPEQGVAWWGELPLCLAEEEGELFAISNKKAVAEGLVVRPLVQTVREILDWNKERAASSRLQAGLPKTREAELLRLWREEDRGSASRK